MSQNRFPHDVATTLRRAGWSPARSVDLDAWLERLSVRGTFERSPAAEAALGEFGGLKIDQKGPGAECAREPFELNPLKAEGYEEEFGRVAEAVGEDALFPIGEVGGGQVFLGIAPSGAVYFLMETVGLLGRSIDEALINLIEGRNPLRVWDIDVTVPGK